MKGSSTILEYLRKFSATEKVVFGIFAVLAVVTAIIMTGRANSYFMREVPATGGKLHEGLVGLPHTVNPVLAVTDVDRDLSTLVYAGLTRFKGREVVSDLASKWSVSEDGLTYTFTLRDNLEFQNGTPLTAEDVVFTVNKAKDYTLKSPRAADWAGVTATAIDPKTVQFTLKQPYASFLAATTLGILPKSIWGNVSDEQFIFSEYNIRPVGAGAYQVGAIDRDQGGIPTDYHLESWNGYHLSEPYISKITFTFFPDLDHALNALNANTIDSLSSVPPAAAAQLATNKGEPYTVESTPLTRLFGVFFNQNKSPILADATIRRALDMSVDRNAIITSVLSGYGTPVASPFPAGFEYGTTSLTYENPELIEAQQLLIKAGWKLGSNGIFGKKPSKTAATTTLAFTLYTADTADLKLAAELLRQQWQKLGIAVTVKVLPPTDLYQNIIRTRDYDALLFGEVVGKTNDLYAFWHSSQRNAPGLNVAMYTNSKADKLLDSIRIATSSADRATYYRQLAQAFREDVPAVFIYSPNLIYVLPKSIQGVELPVATAPGDRFQSIGDWYVQTERVWDFFAKKIDLN